MSAVSVNQEDMDRAEALASDARSMYLNGTSLGTPTIPLQFQSAADYDGSGGTADAIKYFLKVQALALIRLFKNGPTTFPAQLPTYVKASLPSASANLGCLIYVSNDVGGAVPAFSDGTNWRRVTDRNIIS